MAMDHQPKQTQGGAASETAARQELERALMDLVNSGFAELDESASTGDRAGEEPAPQARAGRSKFRLWGW